MSLMGSSCCTIIFLGEKLAPRVIYNREPTLQGGKAPYQGVLVIVIDVSRNNSHAKLTLIRRLLQII